jgi:hypothetical protein
MDRVFDISVFFVNLGVFAIIPVGMRIADKFGYNIEDIKDFDFVLFYIGIVFVLIVYKLYQSDKFLRVYFYDEKLRNVEKQIDYDSNNDYKDPENFFTEVHTPLSRLEAGNRRNEVLDNPEEFDPLLVEYYKKTDELYGAIFFSVVVGILGMNWWYNFILK